MLIHSNCRFSKVLFFPLKLLSILRNLTTTLCIVIFIILRRRITVCLLIGELAATRVRAHTFPPSILCIFYCPVRYDVQECPSPGDFVRIKGRDPWKWLVYRLPHRRCHFNASWLPSIPAISVLVLGMDWPFVELWTGNCPHWFHPYEEKGHSDTNLPNSTAHMWARCLFSVWPLKPLDSSHQMWSPIIPPAAFSSPRGLGCCGGGILHIQFLKLHLGLATDQTDRPRWHTTRRQPGSASPQWDTRQWTNQKKYKSVFNYSYSRTWCTNSYLICLIFLSSAWNPLQNPPRSCPCL